MASERKKDAIAEKMTHTRYSDKDKEIAAALVCVIRECVGKESAFNIGEDEAGSPTFRLAVDRIRVCAIEPRLLLELIEMGAGRLSEVTITRRTSLGECWLCMEVDVFFSDALAKSTVPRFTWPATRDEITNDLGRMLKPFKEFSSAADVRLCRSICFLVYNMDTMMPVISPVFVERKSASYPSEYVCDIQFQGLDKVKLSFLEHLASTVGKRFADFSITATHEHDIEMRIILSSSKSEHLDENLLHRQLSRWTQQKHRAKRPLSHADNNDDEPPQKKQNKSARTIQNGATHVRFDDEK